MAVWQLLQPGDRVIAPLVAYHGTLRQLREYVEPRGIEVSAVDLCDVAAVQAALGAGARMVWTETPANPLLSITDLAAVSALARRAGAWVVCDNTFATPVCQQPFDFGVDLVVHSATKYFGGHSDVMGGVVLVRQDTSLLERIRGWQVLAGGVLGPFDCWLLRRSLATLALRVRAQCASALSVAGFLESHRAVERVHYPGLPTHPNHALAARQMPGGFGAMLSLCVRGGQEAAIAAAARTRLLRRATSLGGVESLIEHRASIEGPGSTTPENLLRVSVGIEDAADLIEDLSQALS
jgi:cystathionine gamma-synthase